MSITPEQVTFFHKNFADYDDTDVILTASQGSAYASLVQRRSNNLGWATTGSVDADNTTLTCNFVDSHALTDIILVGHNFKNFTIKYWTGSAWADFPTPINVTNSTDKVSRFSFASTTTSQIQVTITGTQVADSDKVLNQLIATELLGQLQAWPIIQKPTFDLNKRNNLMLSGKKFIGINLGGFSCTLSVAVLKADADLTLLETLYGSGNGFLVWLCGGSQNQFSTIREGYRLQDFFLMMTADNYTPEWYQGLYQSGLKIQMQLVEVTS